MQLLFVCWADALGRIVLLVFWTVGTNTLKFVLSTLVSSVSVKSLCKILVFGVDSKHAILVAVARTCTDETAGPEAARL